MHLKFSILSPSVIRDGPFDIREGAWIVFEKNSLFPYRSQKNKMSLRKLKIKKVCSSFSEFFQSLFPGSY